MGGGLVDGWMDGVECSEMWLLLIFFFRFFIDFFVFVFFGEVIDVFVFGDFKVFDEEI